MITEFSPIISPPRCPHDRARAYLVSRHRLEMERLGLTKLRKTPNDKRVNADYTDDDIATIVGYYYDLAPRAEIDPALCIAQLVKEAASLTSFWSRRPQRNPAGLGVNGTWITTIGVSTPQDVWPYNVDRNRYEYGLSFPDWKSASRHHIARLLLWALRTGQGTALQKELVAESLALRPFPLQCRGTGINLKRLGKVHNPTGIGWASPGETYGKGLAEIMNAMAVYKEG